MSQETHPGPERTRIARGTRLRRGLPPRLIATMLACAVAAVSLVPGMTLRPLNLEQLTSKAGRIVVGRVLRLDAIEHARLPIPVTRVTLEVESMLKGHAGRRLTFRMIGAPGEDRTESEFPGVPRLRVGESVILFLYPESRSGLTSPVGLDQGLFRKRLDKNGREVVVNGFGNRGLLHGLSDRAAGRLQEAGRGRSGKGPIPSDELARMVVELER